MEGGQSLQGIEEKRGMKGVCGGGRGGRGGTRADTDGCCVREGEQGEESTLLDARDWEIPGPACKGGQGGENCALQGEKR